MALRAGYYGIKRGLKAKLAEIAGSWDTTIASLFPRDEQAVLDAKNLYDCIASTTTDEYGLTWTVDATDKNIITVSGTPTGFKAFPTYSNNVLPAGRYILSGILEDTTNINLNYLGLRNGTSIVQELTKTLVGNEFHFEIPKNVTYDNIYVTLKRNDNNVACSGTIKLMVRLATDPNDTYVLYAMTNQALTTSAADQKTAINAIISAATGAADFAAFKTAMRAITPVTRSLSKEASPENVPEEVIEEKPVTKKTTKKQ